MFAHALLLIALLSPSSSQNLYPDPGFEDSGTPGPARTGAKAGHLRVGPANHWVPLGGSIEVEPFATYRVTVWARGRAVRGTIFAPYCYEWNNFEWTFPAQTPLTPTDEWIQSSVTFISPYDHMVVHPLALMDCADAEAWVDDVVVERVASPEDTIRGLVAKADPSGPELEVLARYHVSRGEVARVAALIGKGPDRTNADLACLVAQDTEEPAARKPYIVQMVRYGGLSLNDGLKRFNEITRGLTSEERLAVCVEAALADPQSVGAARGLRVVAEQALPGAGAPMSLADSERYLTELAQSLATLLDAMPADSPARTEVAAVSETVAQKQAELEDRRAKLGACTIRIGGKALEPETHAIAIPDKPTLQEQHAAQELRYHLELVTGQAFDVVPESEIGERTPIIVGLCGLLEGYAFQVVPVDLGLEGIYLGTKGPVLALVGNQRGVLYATYTFLEEYVGCRWFAPDCSTWPTRGDIRIPKLNRTYVPPLEYRTTDYPNSRDPDWAVRNKNNGTLPPIDEARGGHITYQGFVHTFNGLVPPEEHFAEHPEWFSEIDGKRVKDYSQLCLTNPELLAFVKGRVRQWIEANPSATIISVSQNDWHNPCHCASCAKLAEEEGSEAGPLIHFVNAIADDVKDDYPHIIIDTLAYQYTRKPPLRVKPRPNVAVRLCSIECCFIHPLETDPDAASFVADIVGWSKICNRLHIWDYVINYAHTIMPFPNLYVLKPNINFFIDHGVTGIYEEACYYTRGAELAELRTYIMAKTLWDPTYDTDKAIDEFCAAYYGAAAPMIREYLNTVHRSAQSIPNLHVRIYSPPGIGYLTPEVLEGSDDLFDRAERAVRDDPVLLHRVEVARLPLTYSQIVLGQGSTYQEQGDRLVTTSSAAIPRLARDFARIARAEGLTMVREGGPQAGLDAWLESLPQAASGVTIERLSNGLLDLAVLPDMGGRIWRMQLRADGRDLVKVYGEEGAWDPTAGGYEEYSEGGYRSPGWVEAYSVREKTDRSIRLECKLKNGFTLARTIELDASEPVVRIASTLTNSSNDTKTATFRIHPAFQVETTQEATVRMKGPDGAWTERSLANADDPSAETNVWLRDADLPAGEWTLVDEQAEVSLTQTFDPSEVSHALLNWSGKDSRVNLELFSPEAQLAPGESLRIEQTYRVAAR